MRELNRILTDVQSARLDSAKKARQTLLRLLDLEAEQKRQKYETELIQLQLSRLEQGRGKLDETEAGPNAGGKDFHGPLQRLLGGLIARNEQPIMSLGFQLKDIQGTRASLNAVRHTQDYQFAALYDRLAAIRAAPVPVQVQVQAQMLSPPAPGPTRTETKSPPSETQSGLLSDVHERLRNLQQKRETTLEDTSKFLSSVRRRERKRAMKQVSRVISPESELNALFSFV
jgi:hypothetical protein